MSLLINCHLHCTEVGKASDAFQKGAVIGYKHEEIQASSCDVHMIVFRLMGFLSL